MESPENIAGGYSASGGWGGSGSDPNNNDRGGDDRTVDQLRAAQEIGLLNTNAFLEGIDLSNRRGIDSVVNSFTRQYGPMSRMGYNTAYDRTLANPGGIDTLGYNLAKSLGKFSPTLFGGGVKTNVPELSGTVFSKKAPGGGTLIKSGNTMMGMSADEYYGRSPRTRSDLETYEDKYGYKTPQERALQRGYDQYMNPYNEPGKPGYNRDAPTMRPVTDEVRPGLRSTMFTDRSGQPTALGPLSTMDTDYSGMDRAVMAAAPLTLGGLMHQLTGRKTVIGNVPSMDAMLPTPEMLEQGQTYGGFSRQIGAGFSDVMDGIGRFFSGNQPARKPAPNLTQAELDENMYGLGMPDLGVSSYGASMPAANIQRNRPSGSVTTTDVVRDIDAVLDKLDTGALGELKNNTYNFFTDTDVEASYPSATTGTQMAGNQEGFFGFGLGPLGDAIGRSSAEKQLSPEVRDFLNEHGMTVKDLIDKDFSKVPDGARLPSGQIMSPDLRNQGSQSSRNLPSTTTLADASRNTYRSKYQGQQGLFNPGGRGQTYYGGQQDNSIFNFDDATQRAEEAFNNMINYFRT